MNTAHNDTHHHDTAHSNSSSHPHQPIESSESTWWNAMLTRREVTGGLASFAALAAAAGVLTSCDEDETEAEKESLELQQKEGWDVGNEGEELKFTDKQTFDSKNSESWKQYTQPQALMQAYRPSEKWQPFVTPTLLQALSQTTLSSTITPVCSQAMREAYSRGLGMKELLKETTNQASMLLVVDMSGAESVAFAAALADVVQPVLSFDNWPHPVGVVPAHQTLGALLYYAQEVADKAAQRPQNTPALMVLDANRLAPYTDSDTQFDNRYMAKLPTAENLAALTISSVMYAVPKESQSTEMDDLNDDFATYQEKNIAVSMLPLTRFQQASPDALTASSTATAAIPPEQQNLQQQNQPQQNAQEQNLQQQNMQQVPPQYASGYISAPPVYYYGGAPSYSTWFFYHYPAYHYYRPMPSMSVMPRTSYNAPAYRAVRRPTVFSGSSIGSNKAGIGKQRPTGFGRVTVRTGASSGSFRGVGRAGSARASFGGGRSGSFGRSSFGGRSS